MFDWMLPEDHAIALLKKDHDAVKSLFDLFENTDNPASRKTVVEQALRELKIHAILEEELFYPAVRAHVGPEVMNEADEEHHVAKLLIAELDNPGTDEGHQNAKFTVLAENVRHHIKEEEEEMMPKAKELSLDFETLGRKMKARKAALLKEGVPADAEHGMIADAGGAADSPAKAATVKRSRTAKRTHTTTARKPAARKPAAKKRAAKR